MTLDPAFALAGLELARTSERAGGRQGWNLGMRIARAGRDQLSAADRALLDAMEGVLEDGPEMFRRRNAAVSANPEWPEVWYALGNTYLHYGRLSGQQDALARAERAYRRGWQLDSAAVGRGVLVAAPIGHLVELAHIREDTAEVRRLVARVLAADSSSDLARTVRWHVAVLDGEDARRRYWDQIDLASQQTTMEVALFITWTGIGAADFPVAAAADIRRLTTHDPGYAGYALRTYAANRGRPHDAPDEPPTSAIEARKLLRDRLRAGLWWDGDSLAAAAALGALQLPFSAPGEWRAAAGEGYEDLCAVSLWRAVHGHQAAVTEASARLRAARVPGLARSDSLSLAHFGGLCAALLDATRAGSLGLPGAAGALATADSLAITHLSQACCDRLPEANLLLAKLWEAQGDLPRALQALRRTGGQFLRGPSLLSTFFREEGRVAALTGDTTGAVRAWRQYLALRPDPEPHLRPGVDSVRQAMSALDKR